MSWRTVVVTGVSKLDYKLGYMVVRGEKPLRVFIDEIETLIVESTAVSMTAYLLNELVKHKVKVVFCDEKREPTSELLPYYGCHDTSLKVAIQAKWSDNAKKLTWTEIIREKISQQAYVLEKCGHDKEASKLRAYIPDVTPGDSTNREGHAAKVYFNTLFGMDFCRRDESVINSALNYGYAILLSAINREIVAKGYVTQLGVHHENQFNNFNLGCDFMEPYRPIVDLMVYESDMEEFGTKEKHYMAQLFEHKVSVNGREEYLSNAIKLYVASLLDFLENEGESVIRFYER